MNIDSAMNIDPELQAQVNAQLLEQGAFAAKSVRSTTC